jgi:SulP family sulfate permease
MRGNEPESKGASTAVRIRSDLAAGATVALVGLPQCLAYAVMSGFPPAYGLATAAVPGLVAALLGRSALVITGPTNTTALLVLGTVAPFLDREGFLRPEGLTIVATLTLLCGVMRVGLAWGGGAALVRFIPESVLVGFTVGAGVLIAAMQLDEALGMPAVAAASLWAELGALAAAFRAAHRPAGLACLVALASAAAIAIGRRGWPRAPVALLVVAGSGVLAWGLRLDGSMGLPVVGDRTSSASGWPPGAWPNLQSDTIIALLSPAAAIVLLGTLELAVTARAQHVRSDMRGEILAQGWANVAGAFVSAFPASASLTRSALLRIGNARTRLAAVAAALLTVPPLLFGSALISHLPDAALAGVLIVTAASMIAHPAVPQIWRASATSRALLVVTLAGTLILPLTWAVLIGTGLALLIHLARTSAPRVIALMPVDDQLVPFDASGGPPVLVLEVSGSLHYAAVERFVERIECALTPTVKVLVLDLSHAHELRFTGSQALERLAADLSRSGVHLRIAGVTPELRELLERVVSPIPLTSWDARPGFSAQRAIAGAAETAANRRQH